MLTYIVIHCIIYSNYVNNMMSSSLYEFTGSGWGLWFSKTKCMLYKLGTQENLATDIKPIWGILKNGNLQEVHFRSYV